MTDRNGKAILGSDGKPIMTREYTFTRPDGSKVVIQDHFCWPQLRRRWVSQNLNFYELKNLNLYD